MIGLCDNCNDMILILVFCFEFDRGDLIQWVIAHLHLVRGIGCENKLTQADYACLCHMKSAWWSVEKGRNDRRSRIRWCRLRTEAVTVWVVVGGYVFLMSMRDAPVVISWDWGCSVWVHEVEHAHFWVLEIERAHFLVLEIERAHFLVLEIEHPYFLVRIVGLIRRLQNRVCSVHRYPV